MKLYLIFLSCCGVTLSNEEFKFVGLFFGCDRDVTSHYHKALQDFSTRLFKAVALKNHDHFALSQYSVWLSVSAIAEGTDGETQKRLFEKLNLPQDSCLREKYYEIATSLESPGNDVSLLRKRLFIVDEVLKLNKTWARLVRASGLVDAKSASIRNNSDRFEEFIDTKKWNITSDSVFVDTLDYNGLWTTAFDNSTLQNGDFYDDKGAKIGAIEYLKITKRVKLAYIPILNSKLLELPVGNYGRYRMLFIVNVGRNSLRRTIEHFPSTLIVDSMPLLIESLIPLEIVIPKFTMVSDLDLKAPLQDIGLDSIWKSGGEMNK